MTERQLRGIQARLQAAINFSVNGATCEIDLALAEKLIKVLEQARHVEKNHEE